MEGWVDLGSLIAARPEIEPTIAWSQVRRPNRYATESLYLVSCMFVPPTVTDSCGGGIISLVVRPWVRACVRACVPNSLLARYLKNQWTEFHQTLLNGAVEPQMNWLDFEGREFKLKVATRSYVKNFGNSINFLNGLHYYTSYIVNSTKACTAKSSESFAVEKMENTWIEVWVV